MARTAQACTLKQELLAVSSNTLYMHFEHVFAQLEVQVGGGSGSLLCYVLRTGTLAPSSSHCDDGAPPGGDSEIPLPVAPPASDESFDESLLPVTRRTSS